MSRLVVIMLVLAFMMFFQLRLTCWLNVLSGTEDSSNIVQASLNNFEYSKPKSQSSLAAGQVEPKEDPIPNPPPADGNSTFSACLLVMDDNHRLVEWMAYHYHVLPLRYLIIAVDPRSRTSPTYILNRWRKLGVVVQEWDDFRFMKEFASHKVKDNWKDKKDRHRLRQKKFYRACLGEMKKRGRTWTTLIDTDEFLMYNHKGGKDFEAWESKQLKIHKNNFKDKKRIRPSSVPPTSAEEGAMIKYIQTERQAGLEFYQSPCISIPRLQFSAIESTEEEKNHQMPSSIHVDPDRLDTLRFRKHSSRQDFVKNGLAKSILDVSRIEKFPNRFTVNSVHRPITSICSQPWIDEWSSGLRVNHYLGSWEAYSYRDDSRRGGERCRECWAWKSHKGGYTDDNIRPWVGGFVNSHGPEKVTELLEGAGLARGMQGNDKNWTSMLKHEILSASNTKGDDSKVSFANFVRDFHSKKNHKSIEKSK